MQITSLRVRDLRCLEAVDIEPVAGINIFTGENGSGKTSLLEAIYLLSRGQSFRSAPQTRLINKNKESLSVYARLLDESDQALSIGLERDSDELRFKLSTDPDARLIQLVKALPVQIIDPGLHALFDEGPSARRKFLDWGVFHVEHGFFPAWRRYRRALQQRNTALRTRAGDSEIKVWHQDLQTAAEHIDMARRRYVEQLNASLPRYLDRFEGADEIEINYTAGWPADMEYVETLVKGLERDRQLGYTLHGPHRADLRIRWQGVKAEQRASRGEQKILICNLMLTQAALMAEQTKRLPLLLIDDLAAELGNKYRQRLLEVINELGLQTFLTSLDEQLVGEDAVTHKMFHVEHGRITRA